jgi:hypothetical protein
MSLTLGDLIQTGEDVVTLTGNQIFEFEDVIKALPPQRVNHARVLTALKGAAKVLGYQTTIGHDKGGLIPIGYFAGRRWYAEPKQIDWGDCGLNVQQMQFARMIQKSVIAEFRGSATVLMDMAGHVTKPEALARFEQTLVTALHAYDTARTERLNFLEGEYKRILNALVMTIWPDPPQEIGEILDGIKADLQFNSAAVGDPIGDREPIFPFSAADMQRAREMGPMPMTPHDSGITLSQEIEISKILRMTDAELEQELEKLGVTAADVRREFYKCVEKARADFDRRGEPYTPQLEAAIRSVKADSIVLQQPMDAKKP